MKLVIKYAQDGEMCTESFGTFLENIIVPIANMEDLVYTFEECEGYSLVHFEDVDISIFTTAWLAESLWDDSTIGVFQEDLKENLGLHSDVGQVDMCLAFWTFFNAIGAETYTWWEE